METMGWHMRRALGKNYLAVSLVFREGQFLAMDIGPENKGVIPFTVKPNPSGTLDAAFTAAEQPVLALDLRRLPRKGLERSWFDNPQGNWHIGSGFSIRDQDRFIISSPVTADYEMIVFVARTTAAHSNASLLRRGRSGTWPPGYLASAPKNLGFEEGPDKEPPLGWLVLVAKSYDVECVNDNPMEASRCLRVKFKGKPTGNDGMNLMQGIETEPYLGKKSA